MNISLRVCVNVDIHVSRCVTYSVRMCYKPLYDIFMYRYVCLCGGKVFTLPHIHTYTSAAMQPAGVTGRDDSTRKEHRMLREKQRKSLSKRKMCVCMRMCVCV